MLRKYDISMFRTYMRSFEIQVIAESLEDAEAQARKMVEDGRARWSASNLMETGVDGTQDRGPLWLDEGKAYAQRVANATGEAQCLFFEAQPDGSGGFIVARRQHGDESRAFWRATVQPRGLSKAQQRALLQLFNRDGAATWPSYRALRRAIFRPSYDTCVMVQWAGMWLGIERDGYTHS